MLSEKLRNIISARFGREIRYSQDCEALSEDIYERTGERLGVSTLKRMFGFTTANVEPRPSTMDILARYLGYDERKALDLIFGPEAAVSEFDIAETINIPDLKIQTELLLKYSPDREITIIYIGESRFAVKDSKNSKLTKGDIIKVTNLTLGFELLATEVIRDGHNLGAYRAAKSGGLTSIEILN